MQNRSFTFTFNWLLLLAGLVASFGPLWLAERFLVPVYSSQYLQMMAVRYALDNSGGGRLMLIGDSTIRNLHGRKEDIDQDPEVANLGAGGAMSKEWFYIFRNAIRQTNDFKAVVVGMSNGQAMESVDNFPPYYPFLLDVKDAWIEFRSGRMDWSRSARLVVYAISKVIYTKEDLIYGVVSDLLPPMRQFLMDQVVSQKMKEGIQQAPGQDLPTVVRRFEGVERLMELAKANKLPIFFVLSPTTKAIRENTHYRGMQNLFQEACHSLQLKCADFSDKVPDRCFSEDGVHLREQYAALYKELIENLLKKERIL